MNQENKKQENAKTDAPKKNGKEKLSTADLFQKALTMYSANINALKQFYLVLHPVVREKDKKIEEDVDGIMKDFNELVEEYKLDKKRLLKKKLTKLEFDKKTNKLDKVIIKLKTSLEDGSFITYRREFNKELLYRNIIINICSNLEILIFELLKIYYKISKTIFDDKMIRFGDIKEAESFEEVIDIIVERELLDLSNKSFEDWMAFFVDNVKLDINDMLKKIRGSLIEMFERRHLFIHNDGIVNKKYLRKCNLSRTEKGKGKVKEGKQVKTNEEYVEHCFRNVQVFGAILTYCLWYKLVKKSESKCALEIRENSIMNYGFRLLKQKEYVTAQKYNGIVRNNFKLGEADKFLVDVNYWLSLKFQEKLNKQYIDEIKKVELSNKSNLTKLGIYSLLDKKDEFFETYPKAIMAGELEEESLGWPVFEHIKNDHRFYAIWEEKNYDNLIKPEKIKKSKKTKKAKKKKVVKKAKKKAKKKVKKTKKKK